MERSSFLSVSRSDSFSSVLSFKDEKSLLPLPTRPQPKFRIRALLGHCLYRRVIIWTGAILLVLILAVSTGGVRLKNGRVPDFVDFGKDESDAGASSEEITFVVQEAGDEFQEQEQEPVHEWLKFRHLDGYFNGLRALVPLRNYTPEYPRDEREPSPLPLKRLSAGLPTPAFYSPYPDYQSRHYRDKYYEVETCFLDKDKTIPVPDLLVYKGVVQGQPEPAIGSHALLGLRDDICFDRFGRYGPYGLGYDHAEGGMTVGLDTEQEANGKTWTKTGKINYNGINWGEVQQRCSDANKKRFLDPRDEEPYERPSEYKTKIPRTAIVVRTYVGVVWTPYVILNFRALISELALRSGGEYEVHFLLHVRDDEAPIWADKEIAQQVLDDWVPSEFHHLCTLWSEAQMRLVYPGNFGPSFSDPSSADIHGVYRSAHFPLQHFAMTHPEFAHFWNWEMDMRFLGNYYELFDRLGLWARKQTRVEMWERAQKYYIPRYHGSWANFTLLVHDETMASGRGSVLGPVTFDGRYPTRAEQSGKTFLPLSCYRAKTSDEMWTQCGVGEDADLITLNPLFDVDGSGWVFAEDVTGYDFSLPVPPRRSAIVTASRLSRRLLEVMHEETWRMKHAMFSEMFPATMALHHGLKAVYAPHPVYLDREWDLTAVDQAFNGGRDRTTSGHGSPFGYGNEHNHKGATWYYDSEFAGLLWRRWLGYAQMDGRGEDGGRFEGGTVRGGKEEEESAESTGRMCLRSMLVHPIKWEHPAEIE